jgi:quinoprotein glucose dehydrogenase
MKYLNVSRTSSFSLLIFLIASCTSHPQKDYKDWQVYGGTKESIRYSSLTEIDTSNVNQLQVAWVYHSGDADTVFHSQIQCNPIVVDGILYGTTPKMKVIAVDAANGTPKWVFDPTETLALDTSLRTRLTQMFSNTGRGVTYWTDGKDDKRIFYTAGSKLLCLNALTGRLVTTFGDKGSVDLHNGLGRDVQDLFITSNTPGIIYKDLLILGSRVAEEAAAAPGHLRAFDVRTGQQKWIFHTIPQPGEYGYNTWDDPEAWKHIGGVNSWSGLSLDEERGIVFVPTGSASFDFYGGKRTGQDLFANCVLALDAATGKRIWHFQTVHHDIWDRDLPAAPVLVTITKDGKKIDAIAQTSKTGFLFLFERVTGKPIYPIEERPVSTSTELAGEKPWPTQPMPTIPKPFVRQRFTDSDLNNLVPDTSYQDLKKRFAAAESGPIFTPISKKGTIIFPGLDGGAEWGGPAYDPSTGILYVNAQESPWLLTIIDVKNETAKHETYLEAGKRIYMQNCVGCHGPERQGGGNYPSLIGVGKKYDEASFHMLLANGRRMMPAFNRLTDEEKSAVGTFVLELKNQQSKPFVGSQKKEDPYFKLPYGITGYNKFTTKEGYPGVKPPWGTLNAIDLNTGEYVWKVTLGDEPEFKAKGIHTGTENYGGPVVTAGGLVFIAATRDGMIRAFNKRTGQLLWEHELPAPGFATPSIYNVNGKQYLVIACGGGKLRTKSGDAYVAFALPEKKS